MNKRFSTVLCMIVTMLFSLPTSAADTENTPTPADQTRELIYCADLMTHEEREAYRASMRAARTQQARAELRLLHQEEMRARAIERGMNAMQCEPLRLQQHGDRP